MLARSARGERGFHRTPEQRSTCELACRYVDLASPHRLLGSLENKRHGFQYAAHLTESGAKFPWIGRGLAEQLVVERTELRELNPGLRVRKCSV
jgi:hypothetical protein